MTQLDSLVLSYVTNVSNRSYSRHFTWDQIAKIQCVVKSVMFIIEGQCSLHENIDVDKNKSLILYENPQFMLFYFKAPFNFGFLKMFLLVLTTNSHHEDGRKPKN